MNCSNCKTKLNYTNAYKLLDLNGLSPISLLLVVSLTWSCYQKPWKNWNNIESDMLRYNQ